MEGEKDGRRLGISILVPGEGAVSAKAPTVLPAPSACCGKWGDRGLGLLKMRPWPARSLSLLWQLLQVTFCPQSLAFWGLPRSFACVGVELDVCDAGSTCLAVNLLVTKVSCPLA